MNEGRRIRIRNDDSATDPTQIRKAVVQQLNTFRSHFLRAQLLQLTQSKCTIQRSFEMLPIPILLLFYAIHILAAVVPSPPVAPPSTQGVQGNDDQVMSLHLLQNGQLSDLKLRYTTIQQQLAPGNRRYNMFWSEFESTLPASEPISCPTGTLLVPNNEVASIVLACD